MDKIPKITRDRFEWLKKQHYELWDWLAKNPAENEQDWRGYEKLDRILYILCRFCEPEFHGDFDCYCCPLRENMGYERDEYNKWYYSKDNDERAKLAIKIRDLSWSEDCIEFVEGVRE